MLIGISQTAFISFGVWFLFFLGLEHFKPGIISNYFDLQILFVLALIFGALTVLFKENEFIVKQKLEKRSLLIAVIFIVVSVFWWLLLVGVDIINSNLSGSGWLVVLTVFLLILGILSLKNEKNN
jgi:predicted neutral ceramidase superfamily lipid hydrolase